MNRLKTAVRWVIPKSIYSVLRALRYSFISLCDRLFFPSWLVFQCARRRRKAVVVWRTAAMGDIVCTLPLCREIRKRHPDALLVYVTEGTLAGLVRLSDIPDLVYGITHTWGKPSWIRSAANWCFLFIEEIYEPQTTDERIPGTGSKIHLIEDLAASCGITVTERQPLLKTPEPLLDSIRRKYGLDEEKSAGRLVIAINGGHTWPVREWDAPRWQQLVDSIHAEYPAHILQFGAPWPPGQPDPYREITGVRCLIGTLEADELVGLIALCDLVISIDSGPIHIAGAVGTPSVGLFGAVNPLYRLPPEAPAVGIVHDVPCLYCHHETPRGHWKTNCPFDIRCMRGLEVAPVLEAVRAMLLTHAKIAPRPASAS